MRLAPLLERSLRASPSPTGARRRKSSDRAATRICAELDRIPHFLVPAAGERNSAGAGLGKGPWGAVGHDPALLQAPLREGFSPRQPLPPPGRCPS